ncbi:sperm-associated antigen 1 [Ctenodactylus gundi]
MTAKDYPSLWGFGTTKTYKIPVEHLDFKYIEKCSDIKHLEKILCVLRSGEEGHYFELTEFCEKRLEVLAPASRALRKDKPAATASSFTPEEWAKINSDIKSWVSEIKKEENREYFKETKKCQGQGDHLPPVRSSNSSLPVAKEKSSESKPAKKKIPRDYAEWDKFDVEKECSKVDGDYKEKTVVDNKLHLSKIKTRIDATGLTKKEKHVLATREKEKGNEAFNSGDYEEAVMYYTRSISALPTAAAYNNRAQAEIKLQNWNSAFQDCEKVLELEPGNIKALMRRATTYKHQNKLQEALEDLKIVLNVEPDNDLAKKILSEVEKDLKNSELSSKPQTKGKRMVIEEVESLEDEDGKESGSKHEDGSGDMLALTGFPQLSFLGIPETDPTCGEQDSPRWAGFDEGAAWGAPVFKPWSSHAPFGVSPGGPPAGAGRGARGAGRGARTSRLRPRALCAGRPRSRPLRRHSRRGPGPVMHTLTSRVRFPTAAPRAMGNIQKKLTRRSDGGKRPRRGLAAGAGAAQQDGAPAAAAAGGGANGHPGGGQPRAAGPASLKGRGDELFRSGQFAAAAGRYSEALARLQAAGSESADELSILYSNRAACYLKEGDCRGCIQDCNRALELHPFSMKPLLRRAMAYEALEQYGKAYVDYKTVLQVDCGVQLANDSINRITKVLMELDGPSWREKLPPIPTVPTLKPFQAWHLESQATPDQAEDPSSHPSLNISDEKTFKALKEEGNQYVKDKNYKDALNKYSECLKINNKECAIYTNRALCYLKLCQFEEAKQDCDQALQLDGGNVKACYRRALAHKGLKNYQKSVTDLSKVLLLNPNIIEAKVELEEVTKLLNVKNNTSSLNKGKERRKIEIQEVNERTEESEGTPEVVSTVCLAAEDGDESRGPQEYPEQLQISKPNNAYEFGQVINAINTRKDEEACAHLLAITAPKDLPVLLSNKLEGDTFLLLIQSLKNHLIDKDPSLVYQHLLHLSKADRFKMMLTLISKGQKEQLEQLFDDLSDSSTNHFTLEDIQTLKREYEV